MPMLESVIEAYNDAVFDTDRDRALEVVHNAVAAGISPEEIVFQIVLPAMDQMIGSLEREGGISLAQHYVAAQIADAVTSEMLTKFKHAPKVAGHVIIGTAEGDLHSLGKRIVTGTLKARMIEVTDLGVNVAPERFVEEALAHDAPIIAISAMMVHTAQGERGCKRVRDILDEQHLGGKIKIIVGGAPYRFDPDLYWNVGADAWAEDGVSAGKVIADMLAEERP
jgi:methanogenic corrinoid protein MtbC1